MKVSSNPIFPFPHIVGREKHDGSLYPLSEICRKCLSISCIEVEKGVISLCSNGYNVFKVDDNIIIICVLLRNSPISSKANRKRLGSEKQLMVTKEMLERSVEIFCQSQKIIREQEAIEKQKIIDDYISNEIYKADFMKLFERRIIEGLSFVHDYKQINTQISQNINVIIERRCSNGSFREKLKQATREEQAIYEASKFLDQKLNVAKYLLHPEWLDRGDECVLFNFYSLVLKYLRIYQSRFDAKTIKVSVDGESHQKVLANPDAISVIPHTFLDNAAKYSPADSKAHIYINDVENGIYFEMSSLGPRIQPQEFTKIFEPFFRAGSAKEMEKEGAGYGLYISQLVAKRHLGTQITVEQKPKQIMKKWYETSFSVNIPIKAKVLF